jgi:hypothetical protein
MNRIFKTVILSTAVAAISLTALSAASARDWRRHHHSDHGDAIAAGVLGLATGAIIAGALRNPGPAKADDGYNYDDGYYDQPRYIRRVPVRNYYPAPPRVAYSGDYALEPWTREWFRYCSDRYRSFNARSGTFTGYDGQQHFCNAN